MLDMKAVGERFAQVRRASGLTQEELAEKVTGYRANYIISRLESGEINNIEALYNYAEALNMPLEYFLTGLVLDEDSTFYPTNKLNPKNNYKSIKTVHDYVDDKEFVFGKNGKNLFIEEKDHIGNIIMLGNVDSGKTESFLRPNILKNIRNAENIVVHNPESELIEKITPYARENDYTILKFDARDCDKRSDIYFEITDSFRKDLYSNEEFDRNNFLLIVENDNNLFILEDLLEILQAKKDKSYKEAPDFFKTMLNIYVLGVDYNADNSVFLRSKFIKACKTSRANNIKFITSLNSLLELMDKDAIFPSVLVQNLLSSSKNLIITSTLSETDQKFLKLFFSTLMLDDDDFKYLRMDPHNILVLIRGATPLKIRKLSY